MEPRQPKLPPVGDPDIKALTGKNWLSLKKMANLIGLSYPTVVKMAQSDPPKIIAIKVGGQWRVYETEVKRFLREGNNTKTRAEIGGESND